MAGPPRAAPPERVPGVRETLRRQTPFDDKPPRPVPRDDSARAKLDADRDQQMGELLAVVANERKAREERERALDEERDARERVLVQLEEERKARERAEEDLRRRMTHAPGGKRWDWVTQLPAILALVTAVTTAVVTIIKASKPEPPTVTMTPEVARALRTLAQDARDDRADDLELRQFLLAVFEQNNMSFPSVPGSPSPADVRMLPAPLKPKRGSRAQPVDEAPDIQFATPFPGVRQELPDLNIPPAPAPEPEKLAP